MDPDYSDYLGKDEPSLRALLDVTPEFSERRKIRAAIRALKNDLISKSVTSHVRNGDSDGGDSAAERRSSILEAYPTAQERRDSYQYRKEHGLLLTGDNLKREKAIFNDMNKNPYEKIKDEEELNQMLKSAEELEDRIKIRAALRKLREENKNGMSQNTVPATINGKAKTSHETGNVPTDYSQMQDVHQLEGMLSEVSDFGERKKIRAAIQKLRKQQLAAIATKYSRSNSSESARSTESNSHPEVNTTATTTTTSTTLREPISGPPPEVAVCPPPEPLQSRLVVHLSNTSNSEKQPVTITTSSSSSSSSSYSATGDILPDDVNETEPGAVDSETDDDDADEVDNSCRPYSVDLKVIEKNRKNKAELSDTDRVGLSEAPSIPQRTTSLSFAKKTYPWTSNTKKSGIDGRDNETDEHPKIENRNSTGSDLSESGSDSDNVSSNSGDYSGDNIDKVSQQGDIEVDGEVEEEVEEEEVLEEEEVEQTEEVLEEEVGETEGASNEVEKVKSENEESEEVTDIEAPVCDNEKYASKESLNDRNEEQHPERPPSPSRNASPENVPSEAVVEDTDHIAVETDHSESSHIPEEPVKAQSVDDEPSESEEHVEPSAEDKVYSNDQTVSQTSGEIETLQEEKKPELLRTEPVANIKEHKAEEVKESGSNKEENGSLVEGAVKGEDKTLSDRSDSPPTLADTMEMLRGRLTYLEDELDSCDNFDERREIRASIREVRAQIREETLKLSQKPVRKTPLSKTTSAVDQARTPKALAISRSFSSKEQGRNFLARKLKYQIGRSHSTKESKSQTDSKKKAEDLPTEVCDGVLLYKAPVSRQYSRHDASSAPKPVEPEPEPPSRPPVTKNRRFLTGDSKTLNMSKGSSGYGSHSGSDEEKEVAPKKNLLLLEPLTNVTFHDGENVTMTCRVKAAPTAKVTWYKDSRLLRNNQDFEQTFDGTLCTLTMPEIFPDDAGEYKCVITCGDEKVETVAQLTIKEPERHQFAPVIEQPLSNLNVQDGENVVFECHVVGQPEPTVAWYKGEKLLRPSPDFHQTYTKGVARLHIEDVFPDDNGDYVLVATNKAGEARTVCTLLVQEVPNDGQVSPDVTVPLENQEVFDGDQVTWTCGISGKPKPFITWFKDDKILPNCTDFEQSYDGEFATLVIDEVFEDDTGEYKVVAKNTAGEVSMAALLDVREKPAGHRKIEKSGKPVITSTLSNVSVGEGDEVTLTCTIKAEPRPTVMWYKNGRILRPATHHKQIYINNKAELEFREAFLDDAGRYECVAKNNYGEARDSCRMTVKAITEKRHIKDNFRKPEPVEVKKGSDKVDDTLSRFKSLRAQMGEKNLSSVLEKESTLSRVQSLRAKLDSKSQEESKPFGYSKIRNTSSMPGDKNIDAIDDEDELQDLMRKTDNFDERKKIRNRMKEVREKKAEEYKKKQADIGPQEDAVQMRQRLADQDKNRRLKEMDALDRKQKETQGIGEKERHIREKHRLADEEKQKKLEGFKEMGKVMSQVYHAGSDRTVTLDKAKADELKSKQAKGDVVTQTSKTEKGTDGSTTTTNITTTRKTTKDGSSVTTTQTKQVTQSGGLGTTSYNIKKSTAVTSSGGEAKEGGGGGKVNIQRSPSAIKELLLQWCKNCTKGYEHVDVTNFSSSWNNGMAFCALVHFYRPVFDYKKLNPKCRRGNFKLAFDVAEKFADIAPLLDVDDMVRMKNPDWKCVFTYVQSIYRKFRDEEGGKVPPPPHSS